ncbi:thiamine pyrophosphate-dependent acetolactate synthase large subunit-like protein [Lipingzhangella halophila]|uniref:Thiamine pyrophosphate-dependent acetolactate synthase large subunit-like protein n=1 Tax=Lipingzhangella halophila TaxID=1783352 RepID=A0A7W7RFN9_9ACTN|nr:thiamine pyrophosphate-binding protein [Lipingzhangella halophila]MBB4931143.1 thiamine pyrophosphate-dependent acetolactate synthase large subunit-like protein [Lipingzhangella halophila]
MDVTGNAANGAEVVGATLADRGIDTVFGVVGSGNFVATDALVQSGARFFGARHEAGALAMADAHWRTTGRLAVCSVHQGPGLTNTLTALAEAAKSRSPVVVLAGATSAGMTSSNFYLDQSALVTAAGGIAEHLHRPDTVAADTARACRRALDEHRPVVLNMPLDVQASTASALGGAAAPLRPAGRPRPAAHVVAELAQDLLSARRPVLLAGRGAWLSGAREATAELADRIGARLATTAVVKGMFAGHPRDVGIAGGFSTSTAVRTLESADLILALGASLTTWTTRGDTVFHGQVKVVQVDREQSALGRNENVGTGIVADVDATVRALLAEVGDRPSASELGRVERPGGPAPYGPSAEGTCHPADITARLEELLPAERSVVLDGGHFIGWPAMGWSVPDPAGFVFTSAGFQSIGLGLGAAVGAAIARPDRLTVLATGDGGFLMAVSELETLVRLDLDVLVVVYNDRAYGAEVHHFLDYGSGLDLVRFPETDIAGLARGAGARAVTVREHADLAQAAEWFAEPRGVLVLDVRIDPAVVGPWAEQDFAGH